MADIKVAWGTAVTGTGGINSLASSATWVAGYEWYIIDNSTDKSLDRLQQGYVTVGTTPTANTQINIWAVGSYDGTTWPDVIDGTPSAETWTSAGVRNSCAKLAASLQVDATTSNVAYPFFFSIASLFGGTVPKKVAVFLSHNTGVNLNSTAGNQVYADQPVYATSS
jgi:hypothetical protein